MPAPGPTFRYQGTAIAQELVGGVLARTYVTDEAGRIVKVCDPDCGGSNPQYLVTWSGHGDALALWQIGTGGSLTLVNSFGYSTWGTPTVYNASGTPIAWTDPASLRFRFLYVGAYGVAWDDLGLGLGLQYMAARHYSPSLGRFLQPDSSAAEANLYGYAGGSPVTVVDPSGYAYGYYNVGRYYRIHRPTVRRAAYWVYRRGGMSYSAYLRICQAGAIRWRNRTYGQSVWFSSQDFCAGGVVAGTIGLITMGVLDTGVAVANIAAIPFGGVAHIALIPVDVAAVAATYSMYMVLEQSTHNNCDNIRWKWPWE